MKFSNVDPSHGLQIFTNYFSMGPSHGEQSFRNRLLQHGSPPGLQVLPANLLQHGSPLHTGPQVLPGACFSAGSQHSVTPLHRVTASFGDPPAPAWGTSWAAGEDLLHLGPPWAAEGSLPHHGLLHRLQGNLCSGARSTSSPSFFTDLGVCRVVSLTYAHFSLYPTSAFFPS